MCKSNNKSNFSDFKVYPFCKATWVQFNPFCTFLNFVAIIYAIYILTLRFGYMSGWTDQCNDTNFA